MLAPTGLMVNIDVEDLEAAVRFYEDGLGLRLRRKLFDDSVAEMEAPTFSIYLLQKPAGSSPSPHTCQVRDYRRHWTPVHLDFTVADLDLAVERALGAGARIEGEVRHLAWGRLAAMSDPFGNGFCIVQWIGGGYDEVSSGTDDYR